VPSESSVGRRIIDVANGGTHRPSHALGASASAGRARKRPRRRAFARVLALEIRPQAAAKQRNRRPLDEAELVARTAGAVRAPAGEPLASSTPGGPCFRVRRARVQP
jgi:hypothetical protein